MHSGASCIRHKGIKEYIIYMYTDRLKNQIVNRDVNLVCKLLNLPDSCALEPYRELKGELKRELKREL